MVTKIYYSLLHNSIEPEIGKILWKNQNGFRRKRITTSQILTIRWVLEGVRAKTIEGTLLFVDFYQAFVAIHGWKMVSILLAYAPPKETVEVIMMLNKNMNVKVCSSYGGVCLRGVMVKAVDCGIVVSEFVFQSCYYVHFRANTLGKGINPLILSAMG